jgi:hypothetical protein
MAQNYKVAGGFVVRSWALMSYALNPKIVNNATRPASRANGKLSFGFLIRFIFLWVYRSFAPGV